MNDVLHELPEEDFVKVIEHPDGALGREMKLPDGVLWSEVKLPDGVLELQREMAAILELEGDYEEEDLPEAVE